MNLWDILIIALVAIAVVLAVCVIIRNKKKGKGCCGDCCQCSGCPAQHKKQ